MTKIFDIFRRRSEPAAVFASDMKKEPKYLFLDSLIEQHKMRGKHAGEVLYNYRDLSEHTGVVKRLLEEFFTRNVEIGKAILEQHRKHIDVLEREITSHEHEEKELNDIKDYLISVSSDTSENERGNITEVTPTLSEEEKINWGEKEKRKQTLIAKVKKYLLTDHEKFIKKVAASRSFVRLFVVAFVGLILVEVVFGRVAMETFFPDFQETQGMDFLQWAKHCVYWLVLGVLVFAMTYVFKIHFEKIMMFTFEKNYIFEQPPTGTKVFGYYLKGVMGFNKVKCPQDYPFNILQILLFLVSLMLIFSFAVTRFIKLEELLKDRGFSYDWSVNVVIVMMLFAIGLLTPSMSAIFIHFYTNGKRILQKEKQIDEDIKLVRNKITALTTEKENLQRETNLINAEVENYEKEKKEKLEAALAAFENAYISAENGLLNLPSKKYIRKILKLAYNVKS